MKATDYNGAFLKWENTAIDDVEMGGNVRLLFVDGSWIDYDPDDEYGRRFSVTIGHTCETFRPAKAAAWHLWENHSQFNFMEGACSCDTFKHVDQAYTMD